jgi:hypothetical protein
VDWYSDLAADVGSPPAPPPPPPPPVLLSVAEEEPSYSAVPSINIQDEEPAISEPDLLEDVDMQTCENLSPYVGSSSNRIPAQKVRTLYPYEGQRDEDLCKLGFSMFRTVLT